MGGAAVLKLCARLLTGGLQVPVFHRLAKLQRDGDLGSDAFGFIPPGKQIRHGRHRRHAPRIATTMKATMNAAATQRQ